MSEATGLAPAVDAQEILRKSHLTPSEVSKEMRAEKMAHARRRDEDWIRIEKPWRYETEKPMTEEPDINYKKYLLRSANH